MCTLGKLSRLVSDMAPLYKPTFNASSLSLMKSSSLLSVISAYLSNPSSCFSLNGIFWLCPTTSRTSCGLGYLYRAASFLGLPFLFLSIRPTLTALLYVTSLKTSLTLPHPNNVVYRYFWQHWTHLNLHRTSPAVPISQCLSTPPSLRWPLTISCLDSSSSSLTEIPALGLSHSNPSSALLWKSQESVLKHRSGHVTLWFKILRWQDESQTPL